MAGELLISFRKHCKTLQEILVQLRMVAPTTWEGEEERIRFETSLGYTTSLRLAWAI